MSNCQHILTDGYPNTVGGYDYYCRECGALVERTATQFPPQHRRQYGDMLIVEEEEPRTLTAKELWET